MKISSIFLWSLILIEFKHSNSFEVDAGEIHSNKEPSTSYVSAKIQPPYPALSMWGAFPTAVFHLSGLKEEKTYILFFSSTVIGQFQDIDIPIWNYEWGWTRDLTVQTSDITLEQCFVEECAARLPRSSTANFSIDLVLHVFEADAASSAPMAEALSRFFLHFGDGVGNSTASASHEPHVSSKWSGNCAVIDDTDAAPPPSLIEPALRLVVLTLNRPDSLARLLDSLAAADYLNDTVALDIFVDRASDDQPVDPPTALAVSRYAWRHGPCRAVLRARHHGLRGQWLGSWRPRPGAREVGLMLEDDTAVSPHFWRWLRAAHGAYGGRSDVAGFTLQRLQVRQADGCVDPTPQASGGPADVFLNPVLGSWGFSPTAGHWRRFTAWADAFLASGEPPYVEGLKATGWYKARELRGVCPGKDCMWTMLHIRYTHTHRDRMTVHCRPPRGESLITNYRERGVNFEEALGMMWPLLRGWDSALEVFPKSIVSLDYSGSVCVGDCLVIEKAKQISQSAGGWVILIIFNKSFLSMTRSWLCNTQFMHGIWNKTLLLSPDAWAVEDLAAWNAGLNVVHWDTEGDFEEELEFGQVSYFRLMSRRLSLFIQLLNSNINIFIAESDAVWTGNPLHTLPTGLEWDIAAGWDQSVYMMGFSCIRATEASIDALSSVLGSFESQLEKYDDKLSNFTGSHDAFIFRDYVRTHQNEIKVVALDPYLHLGGKWYTDCASVQYCKLPVTIQNNWIVGNTQKIDRLKKFGQWYLDDAGEICSRNTPAQINQSVSKWLLCRKSPFLNLCGPGCIGTEYGGYFWAGQLAAHSVVYSFGIGEDMSFELGLAARYGLTVHLFDPTPRAFAHFSAVSEILNAGWTSQVLRVSGSISPEVYEDMIRKSHVRPDQLVFHQIGLIGADRFNEMFCGPQHTNLEGDTQCKKSIATFCAPVESSWVSHTMCTQAPCVCEGFQAPVKSLHLIMKELGHQHLAILKLDIEGLESEVLSSLNTQPNAIIVDDSDGLVRSISAGSPYKAVNVHQEKVTFVNSGRNSSRNDMFCKNPEEAQCPDDDGASTCRKDLHHMWSIGLKFQQHLVDTASETSVIFPIQSCGDVNDISCLYMADPFLFRNSNDTWYLFTEVINNDCQKGEIAISVSHDGLKSFKYLQVVLKESWHLSWPFVFSHDGGHYMITCATAGSPTKPVLWLYESDAGDWPFRWERKSRILFEGPLVGYALDPVIFFHEPDSTWYLMIQDSETGQERLFFSDRFDAGFMEHPDSGRHSQRHAGRVAVETAGPHAGIWAFFQVGGDMPGTLMVVARKIERLSRWEFQYSEEAVKVAGPLHDTAFAEQGMHTFGAHRLDNGTWVCVVDGWFNDHGHAMWSCLRSGVGNRECWAQLTEGMVSEGG